MIFREEGEIDSKSREEGEIGSESREKGDLPLFQPPLEGLSVRPRNEQVMLGAPKIMSVDVIYAGEFIRQVFGISVISGFKH